MAVGEFGLIDRFFSGMDAGAAVRLGVGDDAAVLSVPEGHVLHTSIDTAVEGVHFLPGMPPADIAFRSVMAAASDLAAMGAAPAGMLLALTIPCVDEGWLTAFVDGLKDASEQTGLPLVGGDTTRGPLSVTVTVMGSTPTAAYLKRSGAREGDRVCVSGTLGDAAAGLAALRGDLSISDAMVSNALVGRFARPIARLALGESLRAVASAAIDVSDGLLADAAHIADASEVAIDIDCHRLPLSDALRALPDQDQILRWALSGGDDYELLFTLPPDAILPAGCTEIGRVVAGSGVSCAVTPQQPGYDHFTD